MADNLEIKLCESSEDFFKQLLSIAIAHQNVKLSEQAQTYLIRLLTDNINPERLLKKNDDNPYAETPLAIVFQQAQLEPQETKLKMLKFVGDYSLYIGGYFSESLNNKLIDQDYYINMGGNAYNNLSTISCSKDNRTLFSELCSSFAKLVELLTEISFTTNGTTAHDLLKLYDRWLKTGNSILEQKLNERGIVTLEKKLKVA